MIADTRQKEDRRTYRLAELDGAILKGHFLGDRVKRFIAR